MSSKDRKYRINSGYAKDVNKPAIPWWVQVLGIFFGYMSVREIAGIFKVRKPRKTDTLQQQLPLTTELFTKHLKETTNNSDNHEKEKQGKPQTV